MLTGRGLTAPSAGSMLQWQLYRPFRITQVEWWPHVLSASPLLA
jgi:hypothetical protein